MFSLQLDAQASDIEVPDEEPEPEEEPEVVDEFALSIKEDIFQCFRLFDKTQNNTIETKYLNKALKCLGIFLTSTELDELTDVMDIKGSVHFDQFQAYAFDKIKEGDQFEALKQAFQVFDPDNEGLIPSDRFKKWMTTLGTPLTDKEAKELVKLGDPAGKGFVAYDDLVGLLLTN